MPWDRSLDQIRRRFYKKCRQNENGCLIWKAASNGYGRFSVYGESKYAHIVAWYLHTGQWPTKFICHSCDIPLCVNPAHLFEGTAKDNSYDALSKGRKLGAPVKHDPESIRAALQSGLTQRQIAQITGASQATISEIKRGVR